MQILNYARQVSQGSQLSYTFATIVTYTARLQSLFLRPLAVICDATWPAVIYVATISESEKRRRVTNDRLSIVQASVFICRL